MKNAIVLSPPMYPAQPDYGCLQTLSREQEADGSGSITAASGNAYLRRVERAAAAGCVPRGLQPVHGEALQPTRLAPDILVDDAEDPHQKFPIPARDRLPVSVLLFHREKPDPPFAFHPYVQMFSTMTSQKAPTGTARQFPDDMHYLVP